MTQITEAIYTLGVLKPAVDLNLPEQQRVRVIVEPIADGLGDRDAAVARLKAGIASMKFFSKGPLPFTFPMNMNPTHRAGPTLVSSGFQFCSILFRATFLCWSSSTSGLSVEVYRPVDTSR